jgi:outer membrane receptor protein involved in Fe transport
MTLTAVVALLAAPAAFAQDPGPAPTPTPAAPSFRTRVDVIETAPLSGLERPVDEVPAPVQSATARDVEQSAALNLADFLNRRLTSVYVNDVQNNPFQPDVNYRGYTASPLLGTPQGLSVYMDGVRLNQPFGEVVSWDLIPRRAVASMVLMPGSNPLFGLNTLGGALSVQTKDGLSARGTAGEALAGQDGRVGVELEHGGATARGLHWYLTGTWFDEDGWRDDSASKVHQLFGKLGLRRAAGEVALTAAYADNSLTGNGLEEQRLLARDYASVYTKPDVTDNRATFLNLTGRREVATHETLSAHVYLRAIRTHTFNGDINEDSLDQSVYQPGAAERTALAGAGYTGVPANGESAANTPFPRWRCIANALLRDEPGETCNGLLNRTTTSQDNAGASAQITSRRPLGRARNQLSVGAAFDWSGVDFAQSAELGYLNPDRSITGVGAFGDGVTGGDVDGAPFDTRVDLGSHVRTWSVYAADTASLGERVHLTLSGRFNATSVRNRDRIQPGGGPGSLDGDHTFQRLNPAAGLTYTPSQAFTAFLSYSEGSRAPTAIELGCSDPAQPCKLPNAMAGDPPLEQVVTKTWEAGVRGRQGALDWTASVFRAGNHDDILFVMSDQTSFGFFKNFGETRRQGVELGANVTRGRVTLGVGYTYLDATFRSEETVNGESNSSNDGAAHGMPGLEGSIAIEPGNRIPLVPAHVLKAHAGIQVTRALSLELGAIAVSQSYARGNENNRHHPDGTYYLGPGEAPGYAVFNLGAEYRLKRWLRLAAQVNNVFDRRYYTAAQLAPAGFTEEGAFVARPLPAVAGEFALQHSTFLAPGAPLRFWVATRFAF